MTFSVAHWGTWDDSFVFWYAREDIIEYTNGKCHVFAFCMQKEDILEHINAKVSLECQVSWGDTDDEVVDE